MKKTINSERLARDVIVVGASAGGFEAINILLSKLPSDLSARIGIVIHRGARSADDWAPIFGRRSRLPVVEPRDRQELTPGVVYIAPSDRHMTFGAHGVALDRSSKLHFTRPAIDPLFSSAAHAYRARVVGVVLTGGGHDGARGLLDITAAGGLSLVQQPTEAEHATMPESALSRDHVHAALTLDALAEVLPLLARGDEVEVDDNR